MNPFSFLRGKGGAPEKGKAPQEGVPAGPRFRILYQFLLVTLAVSVLPLLAASYKLVSINRAFLEDELLALHSQVANSAAEEIAALMSNIRDNIELVAKAQGGSSPLSKEERERTLVFFLDQYQEIIRLTQYDGDGVETARAVRVGQAKVAPLDEPVRSRAVREAAAGKSYESDPSILAGQAYPVAVMAMPVYGRDGAVASVLLGEVSLFRVQEVVERISIRSQGNAFVVDRRGILVAHQDRSLVAAGEDMGTVDIVGKYLLPGVTAGTIPFRDKMGREMVGSYAKVKGTAWGVVVQEPRDEAYRIIGDMTFQTLLWAVVAVLAAVIASTLFAIRLARPIRTLAQKAMALAQGDFHERVTIRSRNELGQLAQTFNHMAAQLERHDKNLRDLFISTTKSLAAAIDAKDPYTRGHSQRVAQISLELARELGLPPSEQQMVNIAALLHDVGKIGIEDHILKKPTQLTDEEYQIIQQHPRWGAMIMGHIAQLKGVVPGIQHHHERLDGTGYPDRLKGSQIPRLARIIAVADTYDAMTSDRLYQKAMEPQFVMGKLIEWKGSRYDPNVVDAMTRIYGRFLANASPGN